MHSINLSMVHQKPFPTNPVLPVANVLRFAHKNLNANSIFVAKYLSSDGGSSSSASGGGKHRIELYRQQVTVPFNFCQIKGADLTELTHKEYLGLFLYLYLHQFVSGLPAVPPSSHRPLPWEVG